MQVLHRDTTLPQSLSTIKEGILKII
jgi:hypothetical protein